MDFDYTTETITPDVTTILTIGGTGALELPSGTTAQEPGTAVGGALRWNTSSTWVEYYTGSTWLPFLSSSSGVTTFSGGTTGLTPSSATSGSITLAGTLVVGNGGTGAATFTTDGVIFGNGTSALGVTAAGTTGQVLIGNTGTAPSFTNTPAISGANFTSGSVPITALSADTITIGTTTITLGGTSTTLGGMAGITLVSGTVTGVANPVNPTDAVSLQYLQSYEAGLEWKLEVAAATTGALTVTYANGASGVGATLTNAGAQAAFAVDGYTASLGDRILVKNQASALQNGIYTVTTVGSGSTNWVLTRATDDDTSAKMNNATTLVTNGTTNANTGWTQTTANPTIGTSNIVWVQFSGAGSGVSSFQTSLSGLTPSTATTGAVTLAGTLGATSGGTGTLTAPISGQFLYSSAGTTYAPTTLSSVAVTTFSGGTTGLTPSSATSGAITLSGTLILANGGTNASLTAVNGGVIYSTASAMAISAAGTSNQLLQSNGASAPTWTSAPAVSGANITATTIPNSALVNSSITVTGGTGLGVSGSPVSLGGTVTLSNTGVTSIVAGTNIYLSGATGAVTITSSKYWAESSTAPITSPSATGNQSVAIGNSALSSKYGELTHAAGDFAAAGDAQSAEYILRNATTNATPTALFLDGASAALTIGTGYAYAFNANIVCISTTGTTAGSWNIQGLITNFAGTAAIQGNTSTTFIAGSAGLVKGSVTATAGTGSLVFTVTGIAATNIRWVCTCKTVEVAA